MPRETSPSDSTVTVVAGNQVVKGLAGERDWAAAAGDGPDRRVRLPG